jgi:hypothetical protein
MPLASSISSIDASLNQWTDYLPSEPDFLSLYPQYIPLLPLISIFVRSSPLVPSSLPSSSSTSRAIQHTMTSPAMGTFKYLLPSVGTFKYPLPSVSALKYPLPSVGTVIGKGEGDSYKLGAIFVD